MLDLIEKIAHGMCALVVVVVGGLYLWWGTPDTEPEELLPRSIESDIPHPRSRGPDGDGPTAAATSPSKLLAEKRTIMTEVRKNNRSASGARFVHKYLQVQRPTFEYVRNEANWLRQLERIGREDLPPADKGDFTRMKLTHMPENSLLRKLGLRTVAVSRGSEQWVRRLMVAVSRGSEQWVRRLMVAAPRLHVEDPTEQDRRTERITEQRLVPVDEVADPRAERLQGRVRRALPAPGHAVVQEALVHLLDLGREHDDPLHGARRLVQVSADNGDERVHPRDLVAVEVEHHVVHKTCIPATGEGDFERQVSPDLVPGFEVMTTVVVVFLVEQEAG